MNITPQLTYHPISSSPTGGPLASQAPPRATGEIDRARDSYRANAASATVIDAEYVDLPTHRELPVQQQQPPPASLSTSSAEPPATDQATFPAGRLLASRFQTHPPDLPRPGSLINVYA